MKKDWLEISRGIYSRNNKEKVSYLLFDRFEADGGVFRKGCFLPSMSEALFLMFIPSTFSVFELCTLSLDHYTHKSMEAKVTVGEFVNVSRILCTDQS